MKRGKFAKGTAVSVDKSEAEIKNTLKRYGASAIMTGWDVNRAAVQFEAKGYRIRFVLHLPDKETFTRTDTGRRRNDKDLVEKAHDAECRRLFRALSMVVKAKVESVESSIESFEEAFLSHVVVPGKDQTIAELFVPQLIRAYKDGVKMPPLLGA